MSGDNFNRFAKFYDLFIHPRQTIAWKKELAQNKRYYLIDLGGGTGRLVPHYIDLAERVVLADHSFAMLRVSKFANHKQIDRVCCDLSHLPFKKDVSANFVLVDTLHHLYEPKQILTDVLSRIQGDSVLLVEEPDIQYFTIKIIAFFEKVLGMKSQFYTQQTINRWINPYEFQTEFFQDGVNFYLIIKQKQD